MIVILILILANGVFALAEIALVSARKSRLQHLANEGNRGAEVALRLADEPEDFLSAVQIGITLISILTGMFGGLSLSVQLEPYLQNLPVVGAHSGTMSVALITAVITYLSLVLGELVPKQIALNNPERMASLIAYPMWYLARATAPLVWILSASTSSLMRLLPMQPSSGPPVTEAELQIMMEQGAESGVFEPIEEEIVEQLFRVGDQRVNDLMVDRTEIEWLDLDDHIDDLTTKVENAGHSRYPVARGDLDNLVGLVFVKDLLAQCLGGQGPDLEVILKPPLLVPSGLPVYQVLDYFKQARAQIAFVVDEHGGIEGLVTFNDLLEAIVGDVPEMGDPEDPTAVRRADGSWLIDGKLPIDTFKQLFDIRALPQETENYYQTVGGFVMTYLKRVPNTGDTFEWAGLIFEVVDMDWRRVDKVLVSPLVPEDT